MSRRGCCKRGDVEVEVAVLRLKFISSRGLKAWTPSLSHGRHHEIIWIEMFLVEGAYLLSAFPVHCTCLLSQLQSIDLSPTTITRTQIEACS